MATKKTNNAGELLNADLARLRHLSQKLKGNEEGERKEETSPDNPLTLLQQKEKRIEYLEEENKLLKAKVKMLENGGDVIFGMIDSLKKIANPTQENFIDVATTGLKDIARGVKIYKTRKKNFDNKRKSKPTDEKERKRKKKEETEEEMVKKSVDTAVDNTKKDDLEWLQPLTYYATTSTQVPYKDASEQQK